MTELLPLRGPSKADSIEMEHEAIHILRTQKLDGRVVRSDVFGNINSLIASGVLVVLVVGRLNELENRVDLFSTAMILLVLLALSTVVVVWLANHVLQSNDVVGKLAFEAILFVLKLLQGYFFLLFFNLIKGTLLSSLDPYGIIPAVSCFILYFFFSKFLERQTENQFSVQRALYKQKT